jgi:hypothetical protein
VHYITGAYRALVKMSKRQSPSTLSVPKSPSNLSGPESPCNLSGSKSVGPIAEGSIKALPGLK